MIITKAKYTFAPGMVARNIKATIDGEEMFVPIEAEGNIHWEAIEKWVADGNTIDSAE